MGNGNDVSSCLCQAAQSKPVKTRLGEYDGVMQSPSLGKPSNTNLAWIFVKDFSTCTEGKFDIFPQIYASFCRIFFATDVYAIF